LSIRTAAASRDANQPGQVGVADLSVLIVNYNSWRMCVGALESLAAHPPRARHGGALKLEVIVVDNDSPQRDAAAEADLAAALDRLGGRLIMHDENAGYAKGINLAYGESSGRYVLVCNPDVSFQPGCIDALLGYLEEHGDVGAAAPEGFLDRGLQCRLPPNILPTLGDLWATTLVGLSRRSMRRYSARRTADELRVWCASEPVDLVQLSGCCFLMARRFVEQIGLFDPRFPLYYEDTDLSVRIRRAGRRIVQVTGAKLIHFYDRSGQTDHGEAMRRYWISKRAYYRKWYGPLGGWFFDFNRWLLATAWARRRAARPMHPDLQQLPASVGAPTIRLPRAMRRFLVEISLDPRFYLAAGVFGEGDTWTPSEAVMGAFGPTTYYLRVCDVSNGVAEQVGIYSFERLFPEEWKQKQPEKSGAT
jgi:GT2 family glycosyltransferase